MSIHFITVATESKFYFPYLVISANKFNYNFHILGYGLTWKGFNWRNKLVLDYINTINDDDIVIFIDAYDVLFVRDSNEIKEKFINLHNQYRFKIIVGHDNLENSTYFNKLFVKAKFGTCKNISINAGTYGGYVRDLKVVLNSILDLSDDDKDDDQVLLNKYCNLNPDDVYIDIKNEIFLTIDSPYEEVDDLILENNVVKYNGNEPFILHGPGSTFLDNIVIKLKLDTRCLVSQEIQFKYGYYNGKYGYIFKSLCSSFIV